MNRFMDILKTRYEAVLQSSSDPVFYQNVHSYVDYIVKTPELAEIMKKAQHEYANKHTEIWNPRSNDDNELDKREERTIKLERFNLYAIGYCTLLVRIYEPIEDYKITNEDDKDQDPAVLLMLKGINNFSIRKWSKEAKAPFDKWNSKKLERLNKWYAGQRSYYEDQLRKFHINFLSEVEKLEVLTEDKKVESQKEIKNPKIKIFLDDHDGIYRETENGILSYKIKIPSKRSHIINFLFGKDKVKASILATATSQTEELVRKEIEKINELFCENLNIGNVLISKINTRGYSLNTKDFNIIKNQ